MTTDGAAAFPLSAQATEELRELHGALIAHEGDWFRMRGGDLNANNVMQFPCVEEHPLVSRTRQFLDDHQLAVIFDWPHWDDGPKLFRSQRPEKYHDVDADFVRKLLSALNRAGRFNDGVWARAFESGDVQQLLGQLLELQDAATSRG